MEPWTLLLIILLVLGISTPLWSVVGFLRVVGEWQNKTNPRQRAARRESILRPDQVAVLIAARNEELVLAATLRSAAVQVPRSNIHVVSDGSTDGTADVARGEGVSVLELSPNRGKAGALAAGIEHFGLDTRYEVVMLLDADTRLAGNYMRTGLPLFNDPEVVAVAGRARTLPDPGRQRLVARILLAYRERLYTVVQLLMKYGQASRPANVVSIVPGFASMYRARVLPHIDMTAPGLLIEDFNMTFEVHAKQLGRIEFHPSAANAFTQDPNTIRDYTRQVRRWSLGFWQTVRRHGLHPGRFWMALLLHIVELIASSLLLVLTLPLAALSMATGSSFLRPEHLLLGVLLPDFLLTVITALVLRRPGVLLLGLAFPLVRVVDGCICLATVWQAWTRRTGGTWTSPSRRVQESGAGGGVQLAAARAEG